MSTGYALTETDRRLANVVTIGTISAVDVANGLAKVDLDGPESGWIPWATRRAKGDRDWCALEVGEQVVVAAPSGELGNAVIIGSLFQDSYPEPSDSADVRRTIYSDGTVIEYDRSTHQLLADLGESKVHANRTEILLQVGSVKISITESGVAIVGNLSINGVSGAAAVTMNGNFAITGSTITHNSKEIGSTHVHSGVQAGASNTGVPV